MQMARFKIPRSKKINHIFISIYMETIFRADRVLTSMALWRSQDLHIYAPPALKEYYDLQLKVADIPASLCFTPIPCKRKVIIPEPIRSFLFHRLITGSMRGFRFREIRPFRKVNPAKAREYEVPSSFFDGSNGGESYLDKMATS